MREVDLEHDLLIAESYSPAQGWVEYSFGRASEDLKDPYFRPVPLEDVQPGDCITAYHNGHVLMTYPYRYSRLYWIRVEG